MDEDDYQGDVPAGDDPAAAFEALRGEVALLRHAVEGLASARSDLEIPNYQPTLERTEKVLAVLTQQLENVRKSPAMALTPENMGERVNASVRNATFELRNLLTAAQTALDGATRDLSGLVARARRGEEQRRLMWQCGGGGVLAGVLLYAVLMGPLTRALPASWGVPETMATRALGEASQWDAGQRLMQTDAPASWHVIVAAAPLADGNRQAIQACSEGAAKARKAVRCTITVKEPPIRHSTE